MTIKTQTIPYTGVLILLGIASNRQNLIVIGIVFLIGALLAIHIGYNENIANLIGIVLSALMIGILETKQVNKVENFQLEYVTEQNPSSSPSVDCQVFYVPPKYRDTCSKGFFKRTTLQLSSRMDELNAKTTLTPTENTEKQHIQNVLAARASNDIPDDGRGCMLSIPGMKSQVEFDYTDTQTIEARNGKDADGETTSSSSHWAHCWKPFATNVDAVNYANDFGVHGDIEAKEDTSVVFPNSRSYHAQVTFNSLEYDNVKTSLCEFQGTTTQPVTTTDVFIGLTVDAKKMIKEYNAYSISNNRIVRFDSLSVMNSVNDVLGLLFEFVVRDNTLYYQPKPNPSVQLVKIDVSMCGSVESLVRSPLAFSLSSIGISSRLVTRVPDGINVSSGLSGINNQYNDILQDMLSEQNQLKALEDILRTNPETPTFMQGLMLNQYDIVSSTRPVASTTRDMDNIFTKFVGNKKTLKVYSPQFKSQSPTGKKAWEFTGYINIPTTGYYRFKLKSSDAGDVFVGESMPNTSQGARANILVTSHYGYHSADDNGISLPVNDSRGFYLTQGPYKFYARVMEWSSAETFMLYWHTPNFAYWRLMKSDSFMQISNAQTVNTTSLQIDAAKRNITTLSQKLDMLKQFLSTIAGSTRELVQTMMPACIGRVLNVANSAITANDRVYLFVGNPSINERVQVSPTTKQVLVSELIDLSRNARMINSPFNVNFATPPVYTVSLWLYVASPYSLWRSVVFFGQSDDFSTPSKVDRTPAIFVYPDTTQNKGKVFIHMRHRVNTQGKDPNSVNYGLDVNDAAVAPKYGEWFHLAYVVNRSSATVYVNGSLVASTDFKRMNPQYAFEWNPSSKKFYIGMTPNPQSPMVSPPVNPMYVQKLVWFNSPLVETQIKQLSQEAIIPTPAAIVGDAARVTPPPKPLDNLGALLDNSMTSGVKYLKIGPFVYPVYVNVASSGIWLLILNYVRKAGTNPELFVRTKVDGFPMFNDKLGTDGSASRDTWGHVGNDLLNALFTSCGGFKRMLFYARNTSGRVINFTTSDTQLINYALKGTRQPQTGFKFTSLPGHNASIPAESSMVGQTTSGDFALTNYPFATSTQKWSIRGMGKFWETGDMQTDNMVSSIPDTIHQVFIGM